MFTLEEILFHLFYDPVSDLPLTSTPEATPPNGTITSFTSPHDLVIFDADQLDIAFIFVFSAEHRVVPLVISFDRSAGEDKIRVFVFGDNNERQFLLYDFRRDEAMKISVHWGDEYF